jgi:hypothetical protein
MLLFTVAIAGMASAGFAELFGLTFGGAAVAVASGFPFALAGDFVSFKGHC